MISLRKLKARLSQLCHPLYPYDILWSPPTGMRSSSYTSQQLEAEVCGIDHKIEPFLARESSIQTELSLVHWPSVDGLMSWESQERLVTSPIEAGWNEAVQKEQGMNSKRTEIQTALSVGQK